MNINLELYKTFYYITEYGSITAAAGRMCVSQPAVSQSVKQLEENLGVKLFVRNHKGIILTREGKLLADYVKKGYEYIRKGESELLRMKDLEIGEIRIGASDMTLQYYLLPYLEKFHDTYPKIKVTVTNGPTPETLKSLEEGKIDFGIVSTPFEVKNEYDVTMVKEIEDIFIASSEFEVLKDKEVSCSDISKLPLICLEKNTSTRRYVDDYMKENGVVLEPEFELATSNMIVQFAKRNLGVGCVMSEFAGHEIEKGELFEVKLKNRIPARNICVVTYKKMAMSAAGRRMLELVSNDGGKGI